MCERLSSASKNTISFSVSFSVVFLLLFLPLDPFDPLDPLTRWVELIQKSWTTRVRVLNVRLVSRGFSDCINGSRMTPSERRLQRREQTASFATNCVQSARGVSRFFWPSRIVPSGPRARSGLVGLIISSDFQSLINVCRSNRLELPTKYIPFFLFMCSLFFPQLVFSLSSISDEACKRTMRVHLIKNIIVAFTEHLSERQWQTLRVSIIACANATPRRCTYAGISVSKDRLLECS